MNRQASASDPGRGILGRITEVVYWYLIVELCFLLAALPGFAGIVLLDRSPSNIPLYALCLVPVAPAWSAAIATIAARARQADLSVWPRYWRSYVANVRDVLLVWVPALVLAAILGLNVAFGPAAGVNQFFVGASLVLLVVVALWSAHAVLIASLFRFRARDTARLALYYLAAKPLVTLGAFAYLLLAVALVAFTSDWVLALLGVFFAAFAVVNARAMTADIAERFVEGDGGAEEGPAPRDLDQ